MPFRLVVSDGTVYEVRHPDLTMVALSTVVVGYPSPKQPEVAMRFDLVSMRHVMRIEPLELSPDQPAEQGSTS